MNIYIQSRNNALIKQHCFYKLFGIISITDVNSQRPDFDNPYAKVLYLQFNDEDDVKEKYSIQACHAVQILDFLKKETFDDLIVHCEAGICRSAGAAAAISKIFNGTDDWVFESPRYHPNMLVYRMILNQWEMFSSTIGF